MVFPQIFQGSSHKYCQDLATKEKKLKYKSLTILSKNTTNCNAGIKMTVFKETNNMLLLCHMTSSLPTYSKKTRYKSCHWGSTSVAKSAVFPRNWATLTLFPRAVFHVRGLRQPIMWYLTPGMRLFNRGTPAKKCVFHPKEYDFYQGDPPETQYWALFGLVWVAIVKVFLRKPGNPGQYRFKSY